MKKYPVGSEVKVQMDDRGSFRVAEVLRNGRDERGIYTEVKYKDGTTERVNRSLVLAPWPPLT